MTLNELIFHLTAMREEVRQAGLDPDLVRVAAVDEDEVMYLAATGCPDAFVPITLEFPDGRDQSASAFVSLWVEL